MLQHASVLSCDTILYLTLSLKPFSEVKCYVINGQLLLCLVYSFGCWFDTFVPFSSLIFSAFVATSLAFGSFSAAALVARRREYIYLGGLLSSGLSILMWLHFASSIFGSSIALFKFEVTINLIV